MTRNWRDRPSGVELEYWFNTVEGPLRVLFHRQESVFFLSRQDFAASRDLLQKQAGVRTRDLDLNTFAGDGTVGVYSGSHRQARQLADRLRERGADPLESDINPADRFLMERFIQGSARLVGVAVYAEGFWSLENPQISAADYQPPLRVLSFDIETAMDGLQLYSVGAYAVSDGQIIRRVFMVGSETNRDYLYFFPDQERVLAAFLDWLQALDPDVLIGWNVINFDCWYLQRLAESLGSRLQLARAGQAAHWRSLDKEGDRRALHLTGRVVLDGIELLRTAFYHFESYSLEHVARQLLGEGKLITGGDRGQEITELFRKDKRQLAEYNLKDCELVWDIFETLGLMDFAIARSRMTGLAIDRAGGSVASFDYLYLPRLHRAGYVAPNPAPDQASSPGGFVLDSQPGIYDHVLVLDFKSLYPSIIRTFFIDPLGLALGNGDQLNREQLVEGFLGAQFAREGHILPQLIEELWQRRDRAKSRGDTALSQAIKIIMNSFYGVLGSSGCRFFDARLASSITRRGHEILKRTRDAIELGGHRVIYGDTDSVFVWVREAVDDGEAEAIGRQLQSELNGFWRRTLAEEHGLESLLELEFETHYRRFLMPTVRGSDKGSKKRYAGLIREGGKDRLVFKGLENVRTDWTPLARDFQKELYNRIFHSQEYRAWLLEVCQALRRGELDHKLVYRKRLRRRLDEYRRNIPPHVQAARLARDRGLAGPGRGDWVEYVITRVGPEPAAAPTAPLDYDHYQERQLAPVADGILHFEGTTFRELIDQQIALF